MRHTNISSQHRFNDNNQGKKLLLSPLRSDSLSISVCMCVCVSKMRLFANAVIAILQHLVAAFISTAFNPNDFYG